MKRGGYDSYGPDEVLKRAHERGENVGWDRLFRSVGTAAESVWLAVLAVLAVAAAYLAGRAFLALNPLTLALVITVVTALISARIAGWLVAPYDHAIFRRLMWGLSAAALLLLTTRVGLVAAEFIQLLFKSGAADAESVRAFNAAAALFTLIVAIPVWLLYALWGRLTSRPLPQHRAAGRWRRGLPIVLVLAMTIFLVRESIYFAAL